MSNHAGDGPDETAGEFWLPATPEQKVPGRYKVTPDGIHLELHGALTPALREVPSTDKDGRAKYFKSTFSQEGPRNAFTVHGALNSSPEELTLLRCSTYSRKAREFGYATPEQHLRAMFSFRGAHLPGDDSRFTSFSLRVQHLDEWANLDGFYWDFSDFTTQLTHRLISTPSSELSTGGKITLASHINGPTPTARGGFIHRTVWFDLTEIDYTWEEIDRLIVTPLANLLTLSTGHQCDPIEYRAQTHEGEWVQIQIRQTPQPDDELEQHRIMVSLADITLDGVSRWLDGAQQRGPLPPVVARTVDAPTIYTETFLLELTTIAEGLHSRLFPDERRADLDTADRIKKKIAEALADEDRPNQQAVSGLVQFFGELSYTKRLAQLAQEVQVALPGVTGNTKKWISTVSECRNYFAHRRTGFSSQADRDKYLGVIQSLRWVLVGVLLLQTGIDPNHLAEKVEQYRPFTYFLSQAAIFLPDVYESS
jgi:hypothetical protein